ncbi:MAG TPA: branched-chain amino acid ABC transporter permease, partial [Burkholderiales bacterium]|nr:branched-chain amino acid ABC transporter permease [Burkholderiales bacterium]
MDFYYGLAQTIGVHTLLGLSAYIVLLTGQVTMAQAAFFAVGAYTAGMLTVLGGWHLVPAIGAGALTGAVTACAVGFPALRVKGLMLVVATLAFGEGVRLFFFNFDYQVAKGEIRVGPLGGEGALPSFDEDFVGGAANLDYTERPTITYTPLAGEAFSRRMLQTVPIEVLFSLGQSGWPPDVLLRIAVQRIGETENIAFAPGNLAGEQAFRAEADKLERYDRVIELLLRLQHAGAIEV